MSSRVQMTTYPLIMSKTFFTNIMGNMTSLTPPPKCKEKVIGAGGTEVMPVGCFQVKVSFPLMLDWPKVALTCCVYQNLMSDILLGSPYLKYVSPQHPLTVSQLPGGYVFNSLEYSQPSLTTQQAHQCNQELTDCVYADDRRAGRQYTNPGLGKIKERWERQGHSAHRTPRETVGGDHGGQVWGVAPSPPSLNAKGWPCPESLVRVDPSVLGGSVLFRTKDKITIRPGTTQKVQVYYPNTSMDPARFHYFVEGTDRWGNQPEAGQLWSVRC